MMDAPTGLKCARNAAGGNTAQCQSPPTQPCPPRHAPQAPLSPPDWWRARASAPAPPPDPSSCGAAPPPDLQAAGVTSKLERGGAGAKRLCFSEAEGTLSHHACALAVAPGLAGWRFLRSTVRAQLGPPQARPFISSAADRLPRTSYCRAPGNAHCPGPPRRWHPHVPGA